MLSISLGTALVPVLVSVAPAHGIVAAVTERGGDQGIVNVLEGFESSCECFLVFTRRCSALPNPNDQHLLGTLDFVLYLTFTFFFSFCFLRSHK